MRNLSCSLLVGCLGLYAGTVAAATAVEYFDGTCGHYFVTAKPAEIVALDAGRFTGWRRTGQTFEVLPLGTPAARSVCRFWSGNTFTPLSTHFYTAFSGECADVRAKAEWTFEGEVFAIMLPDATGGCAAGMVPLYRLYNNGFGGSPNHRYTTHPAVCSDMLSQGWIAEGYGMGVVGCVPKAGEDATISGRVLDGTIEGALVCLDTNRNGRCDELEAQATSDPQGSYRLTVPKDTTDPLIAEIIAGRARDSATQSAVDRSYRMASPAPAYSADITPYATLVHLVRLSDHRLAEDLVRAHLGLPPGFVMQAATPPAAGSLRQSVGRAVVEALKASGLSLDLSRPDALAAVIAAFPASLTDLPQLAIATRNGAPIESREVYVDATFVLTNPAAATPTATLNGKVRGRGHSTWGQPKNPYKVQFTNDASYAAMGDVLGMKKQRNWALLADYFDRSLMRNKLALSLGASSVFADGLKWTPVGQHVEVTLNGDYVGVYLLTEDIRIDAARLNVKKMGANDVDGGYIVEVDARLDCYKGPDVDMQLVTPHGVPICIDTPDEEAITPNQLAYIKSLLVDVETDLYGTRQLAKIDQPSFADAYLLQELFRNNDAAFFSSVFLWKDTAAATNARDRVLNMGPLWDFDRSAGNVNYNDNWKTHGCWVSRGLATYATNWYGGLFDSDEFLALTLARWQQRHDALHAFLDGSIDAYARRLRAAAERNFERWPIFGIVLTNYYMFANHAEEVGFVKQFLNERMGWLDTAYANPEAFRALCK